MGGGVPSRGHHRRREGLEVVSVSGRSRGGWWSLSSRSRFGCWALVLGWVGALGFSAGLCVSVWLAVMLRRRSACGDGARFVIGREFQKGRQLGEAELFLAGQAHRAGSRRCAEGCRIQVSGVAAMFPGGFEVWF